MLEFLDPDPQTLIADEIYINACKTMTILDSVTLSHALLKSDIQERDTYVHK